MSLLINFSLFACGVFAFSRGLYYAVHEKGKTSYRFYFLIQGIMVLFWCGGYALMGESHSKTSAAVFRAIGLLGVIEFMTAETWFLVLKTRILKKVKFPFLWVMTIAGVVDIILFGNPANVEFTEQNGRVCFLAKNTPARFYHDGMLLFFFIFLLIVAIYWRKKTYLRRDIKTIYNMIFGNVFIVLCSMPDTFLPLFNLPSIPSSGYGAFLTYYITYYFANEKNAFLITTQNVGRYVYEDVDAPVLVLSHDKSLTLANAYAKNFFGEICRKGTMMHELFEITQNDCDEIFDELSHEGEKDCRLISLPDRKPVAVNLVAVKDDYEEPYCFIGIVYDLSKENEMLEQVTKLKNELELQLENKQQQVEQMNLQTITTVANIIDARDEYTKGHSVRVSGYCERLVRFLDWDEDEIQNLKYVALLHDIGKVGVPDSVLNKPGKLTEIEFGMIKAHTTVGDGIVKDIEMIGHIREGVRFHHERWDGKGYPDGLAGDEIPVYAQIIAIADSFDAMNSNRVYRNKLSKEEIEEQLEKGRGKQFAPHYLDDFLKLYRMGMLELPEEKQDAEEIYASESNKLFERVFQNYGNEEKERDYLTGLWGRNTGERLVISQMKSQGGCLACLDLDNLKVVNDLYGHMAGDYALKMVADSMEEQAPGCTSVRLGGDEFLLFMPGVTQKEAITTVEAILYAFRKKRENEETMSETSISAGMYMCSPGTPYQQAFQNVDRALYHVKQNGKQGYYFYSEKEQETRNESVVDLKNLMGSLNRQGNYHGAYNVNYREFSNVYKLVSDMAERFDYSMKLLLVTASSYDGQFFSVEEQEKIMTCMRTAIKETLRTVDVSTRFSSTQYLVILTNAKDDALQDIVSRIFQRFYRVYAKDNVNLSYDVADYKHAE